MLEQVLHPKHKLKYFKKQGWDCEWITTTENVVREEFKSFYANYISIKPSGSACTPKKKVREHTSLSYVLQACECLIDIVDFIRHQLCLPCLPLLLSSRPMTPALRKKSLWMRLIDSLQQGRLKAWQTHCAGVLKIKAPTLVYGEWLRIT